MQAPGCGVQVSQSSSPLSPSINMSTIALLRAIVNQRLTVAVKEVFGVFERTFTEYEEEIDRQRRLLEAEGWRVLPGTRVAPDYQAGACHCGFSSF